MQLTLHYEQGLDSLLHVAFITNLFYKTTSFIQIKLKVTPSKEINH